MTEPIGDNPPGVSRRKVGGILAAATAGLAALYGGLGRRGSNVEEAARHIADTSVEAVKQITWTSITVRDFGSGWRLDKALEEKWGVNLGQEGVQVARQINGKQGEVAGEVWHIPARPPRDLNLPGELVGFRAGQEMPAFGGKLQKIDPVEQRIMIVKPNGEQGIIDLKADPGGVEFVEDKAKGMRSVVAKVEKDVVIVYQEGDNYKPQIPFKPEDPVLQTR